SRGQRGSRLCVEEVDIDPLILFLDDEPPRSGGGHSINVAFPVTGATEGVEPIAATQLESLDVDGAEQARFPVRDVDCPIGMMEGQVRDGGSDFGNSLDGFRVCIELEQI